jgi:hypothetical protein
VNWTAASAGAVPDETDAAGGEAAALAQDEAAADDATAGRAEPAADGADPVEAAVDELEDVVAQPAASPPAATATMVENTVRRVINGISFVTFERALRRLARS